MSFVMSIGEMLKYREILKEKSENARATGNHRELDKSLRLMDAVDIVLDAAFIGTVQENAPYISKVLDQTFVDRSALALVVGTERVKSIPLQGTFDFRSAEVVQPIQDNNELETELQKILGRDFVKNIPNAIKLYKEHTKSQLPDSKIWIEIKGMLNKNELFNIWDASILRNTFEMGPVMGFMQIKKHLKDWTDLDIAILMNNAIECALRKQKATTAVDKQQKAESSKDRVMDILEKGPANLRDYLKEAEIVQRIATIESLSNKTEIGRRMKQILEVTAPSKRAQIITRKEYVEKGY